MLPDAPAHRLQRRARSLTVRAAFYSAVSRAKSHGPAIFFRGLWGASGAPTVHNLLTETVQVVREGPGASGFLSIAIPPTLSNLEVAASALG